MANPPNIVLDTNVFIRYFLNPQSVAAKCLEVVEAGKARLFTSRDLLAEIRDVLSRPKFRSRLPVDVPQQIDTFSRYLSRISNVIDPVSAVFTLARDPKDEIILNLAIAAHVDFIVTRDNDLLDLMTGYSAECKEFRQRFRTIRIMRPDHFLIVIAEGG